MTGLMRWFPVDETQPYPWAMVPCPDCGETELAGHRMSALSVEDFVCMACGCVTKLKERP